MRLTHSSILFTLITSFVLLLSGIAVPAHANDFSDVNALVRAGKLSSALSRADQYLASHPGDPKMRLIKGVIQRDAGQTNEAIATFTKLTRDFPELPEPYNNLAVLYASQNQYDKARSALEMALRTNPSYSIAHENLSDVYAKLASQAYHKALQSDAADTDVQPRLTLIREVFNPDAKGQSPITAATRPTPTAAPASQPAPTIVAAAPAPQATAITPHPTPPADTAPEEVRSAVLAWAKAWAEKNMTGYLGAYSRDYRASSKSSRAQWEKERRLRILGKSRISVRVNNLKIDVKGDKAEAKFHQEYKADSFSASSNKILELEKIGGHWLITREAVGS